MSFNPLSPKVMHSIVAKFVKELRGQLLDKDVELNLTQAGIDHLAEAGYDPENGARPLARVIQNEIKRPLGDELLFGALEKGGTVTIDAVPNPDAEAHDPVKTKLTFSFDDKAKSAPVAPDMPDMLN